MGSFSNLKIGSQGDDTREWQNYLIGEGYDLKADGIFGSVTDKITKAWQKAKGLVADGIVGKISAGVAGLFGNNNPDPNKPTAAPTASPLPTAPTYDTTSWDDTEKGKEAAGAYDSAKDAVANYGDFTWDKQGDYDALYDKYTNRGPFSYDFNADALYQQYKDKYMQQGKMASQDVMGQAAAMTGGYGNSYAATVGNQAYQQSLQQLNDVIPELYQLAYSKYNQEGQDMLNAMGLLEGDRAFDYGLYTDKYGRLVDAYGIASDDYYKGADMHYTEQNNKNTVAGSEFQDAMSIWDANNTNAWEQAKWDESLRQFAIDQDWKQKEWDESLRRYEESKTTTGGGGGGGAMYDTDGNVREGYTTTNSSYFDDNGNFKKATFSRYDGDGNAVWYIGGKEVVRQAGANPYTGAVNPDTKHGTFSNGYQPNNIKGQKLSKSGIKDSVNGVEQNVWKTPDGKLWIWDGTQNKYLSYTE